MDTEIIHIRVGHALKAKLAELAAAERRSLSNLVAKLIEDCIARQEVDGAPKKKRGK